MKNFCPKKISTNKKYWHFCFVSKFQTKQNKSQQPTGNGKQCRSSTVVNIFSLSNFHFHFCSPFFCKKMAYYTQVKQVRLLLLFSSRNNGRLNFWLSFFVDQNQQQQQQQSQLVRTNKQTIQDSKTKMDIIIGNHCYMTKMKERKFG